MGISYYDLLGMVKEGNAPSKIDVKLCGTKSVIYEVELDGNDFNYYYISDRDLEDESYQYYLSECFLESSMFDKCITILDEEKEIEIPQEFLKDVTIDSEIVLIKDDIGHDYGYKNSIGFITSESTCGDCFIFAFDKRANRWWECRFEKDEYIRTGLYVSDLFRTVAILISSKDDEFEDIEEIEHQYIYGLTANEEKINDRVSRFEDKINQLIKNQKKIINKLKELEK